ncbi:dienelactone hydrolase family protein [Verrucomicrobiota bacterium sgz303538]
MRAALFLLLVPVLAFAEPDPQPLDGTQPLLSRGGDLSLQMVTGINRFLEQETLRATIDRTRTWQSAASGDQWDVFVAARREQLRRMIGAIDARTPGRMEEVRELGDGDSSGLNATYTVQHVRWPVFDGVYGEGLLLLPVGEPRAIVVAIPDADQRPHEFAFAFRLVQQSCAVLVPELVDRRDTWSGNITLNRFTNQPLREWIHRQAFELGRTLIGYEVQKILAALDALVLPESPLRGAASKIAVAGYGEGGLLALHCAALDERISATVLSGYFGPRERVFAEPLYRNLFGQLRSFGDAELAALIAPRRLIVEYSRAPEVNGPPSPRKGRAGAAPGSIMTPDFTAVSAEIHRANDLLQIRKQPTPVTLISSADGQPFEPGSTDALATLLRAMNLDYRKVAPSAEPASVPKREGASQQRAVRELEQFTQRLVSDAERLRHENVWSKVKPGVEWDAVQRELRTRLSEEVIGKLSAELLPANPRTRLIMKQPKWTAYEVVLDVLPEVFAWGWLLVPSDLKPDERRPVVVCQHGLEGLPEDVVTNDPSSQAFSYYKGFAARLAERGFVVFAPHNPYRGGDQFRMIQRRANPLGLSLFSFIVAQHDAATRWLASLPFVDPKRIAFYGLSYGGKSAMRLPALLDRYCLSICSGDFNEWVRKNVSPDAPFNYMFTGEWEMPEWNLAQVASYAEMAMLIAPRPFMVERGHDDTVGADEWVGYEYAKVRRGYVKLGMGERTEIEWFNGPHTIHGECTFRFLYHHLGWPEPQPTQ